MSIIFAIILHILLLGSLLLFAVVFLVTAWYAPTTMERYLRVAAVFAGAMISLGATASGVNYANFTVDALAQGRTVSAAAHFFSVFVPAVAGAGIGFFLVRTVRKSTVMAMRVMGFVGMLATTAFIEVYAQAATVAGFKLGSAALPNVAFTAGVILTVVFTLQPEGTESSRGGAMHAFVSQLLQRRGSGTGTTVNSSSLHDARATATHYAPVHSDDRNYRGL
jgi:hypothetical protein